MPLPRSRSKPAARQAAFQLWLVNLGLGVLVGTSYLAHVPDGDEPRVWLFCLPALLSTVLSLTLVPGLFSWLGAHFLGPRRALGPAVGFLWMLFQVLLFADTRIYNVFRYHFNGQVLSIVYTRGSADAVSLGWQVWTAIVIGLAAGTALQLWLWNRLLRHAEAELARPRRPRRLLRPSIVWGVVLLPAVFVEKTIYAQADLARDRQVTALARLFPLYARVPMEDLASRVLGVEVDRPPRVELDGVRLDYPRRMPSLAPDGPRPNVLVVVIDCLRRDAFGPQTTPELERWSRGAKRFENHLSGGNSTRYGLFALLYGLHGSYWFPFVQERRSPVLVDTLLAAGYELGVFSSASMHYPELRETAWVRIPHAVHDDFPAAEAWRRDEQAAEALLGWLAERAEDERPFFGFILLDSPHQTYSFPPGAAPFQPIAPDVDYLTLTRNDGPTAWELERVRNRYRNAVRHADEVAARILAGLDQHGLADRTLVVVTGDHGEEFRECGFFGHTSAYTPQQVEVPFVMRGPGVEPGREDGPTSHLDFAPTLLEILGADPAVRPAWTLGESLFAPRADRRRVLSGWNELGVWTPEGILRVPLSPFEFDVELYDYTWTYVADDRQVLAQEAATLVELGAECNRFLR
jgi:hypothetical protein